MHISFLLFFSFSSKVETLTWVQVNRQFKTEYVSILSLFDLILSIPATSVACERGFYTYEAGEVRQKNTHD